MKLSTLLLLTLPLAACTAEASKEPAQAPKTQAPKTPAPETPTPEEPAPKAKPASFATHVQCGCSIKSIGRCGNYVEVDSAYIPIGNSKELGLGVMEWCATKGPVAADVAGEVVDGQFIASQLDTK